MRSKGSKRLDRDGRFRPEFTKNRLKVIRSQDVCAICGRPVDKLLKYPDPMSPTVDHIKPLAKGGHPSDISNLQLAHRICNRLKSDKDYIPIPVEQKKVPIYQTTDWKNF